MPKQLKASKVERIVKEITNQRNDRMLRKGDGYVQEMFEIDMKEKYPVFAEDYKQLFSQTVTGTLEPGMFKYMIMMLKQVEGGNMTEHSASIKVGEVLVDKYVKPLIDEDGK